MSSFSPARRVVALACAAALIALSGCGDDTGETKAAKVKPVLAKEGTITVCSDIPYEPFESMNGNTPVGFDVDIANEVGKTLDLSLTWVDSDFDAIQNGELLNTGACDLVISAMTITGERARSLDFSRPYFDATQAMVVPTTSVAASLADMVEAKIGVQSGTTGELYITDNAPTSATVVPLESVPALTEALLKGEIDAAVFDNTVVGSVVKANAELKVAAEFDTGEQYGLAVKKDGNPALLRAVDETLSRLRSDGTYDKIFEKWFGKAG
ncbi:MAG: ABC transporter substrate-binding protein [Nocardioides sp.]